MSHEELVSIISERAGISKQTVRDVLFAIAEVWGTEILDNGELDIDHIGEFMIEHRPGRKGLNTETRELFLMPPRDYLSFYPTRELVEWSNKPS